jgi:hypothetical protein
MTPPNPDAPAPPKPGPADPAPTVSRTTVVTGVSKTLPDPADPTGGSVSSHFRVVKYEQYETALSERHKRTPPVWEIGLGAVLVLGWVVLFGAGTFVPTADYRADLLTRTRSLTAGQFLEAAGVVLACYTVTNILFLALIASCVGCMTCRWRVTGKVEGLMNFYAGLHPKRIYLAALLRGFFLYLMVISGFLILSTEESMVNTGFAQYIRVAGITSVMAFMVGYDPQIAYRLMGRLNEVANKPLRPGGGGPDPGRDG